MKNKSYTIIFISFTIFIMFISSLLLTTVIDNYNFTTYFLTYEKGFISRGLLGTIFQSILPIDNNYLYIISRIFKVLIFLFIGLYLIKIRNISKKINNQDNQFLYLIFAITSFPICVVWYRYLGKVDIIWMLSFLLIIYVLEKKNFDYLKSIIISTICIFNILSHQGFIFIVFPFLFLILLDDFIKNRKNIFSIIFITLTNIITFCICQFYKPVTFNDIATIVFLKYKQMISDNISVEMFKQSGNYKMLVLEYKISIFDHFDFIKDEFTLNLAIGFLMLLNLSLNLFFFFKILKKRFHILTLIMFCLYLIPLFVLTCDTQRWIGLLICNLFILSSYFIYKYNLLNDFHLIENYIFKKPLLIIYTIFILITVMSFNIFFPL